MPNKTAQTQAGTKTAMVTTPMTISPAPSSRHLGQQNLFRFIPIPTFPSFQVSVFYALSPLLVPCPRLFFRYSKKTTQTDRFSTGVFSCVCKIFFAYSRAARCVCKPLTCFAIITGLDRFAAPCLFRPGRLYEEIAPNGRQVACAGLQSVLCHFWGKQARPQK